MIFTIYEAIHMPFIIDERIFSSCFELGDWPLSRVLLKNNIHFPWFILVPRQKDIQEIVELPAQWRHVLIDEISELSSIVKKYFNADKLNIGSLGNMVPQLHVHVIARFKSDSLWPHGIWQLTQPSEPYPEKMLQPMLKDLRQQVTCVFN